MLSLVVRLFPAHWLVPLSAFFALSYFFTTRTYSQELHDKKDDMELLRKYYSSQPIRLFKLPKSESFSTVSSLLNNEGIFVDLVEEELTITTRRLLKSKYTNDQQKVSSFVEKAFSRLWLVSEHYREKKVLSAEEEGIKQLIFKAIIHYGEIELSRTRDSSGRFHVSCFSVPLSSVNIYFSFFEEMNLVEVEAITLPMMRRLNQVLRELALQAWTLPLRKNSTDSIYVNPERFRWHVHWEGGNALTYRPVFHSAIMLNSPEMVDTIVEVAKRSLSITSQSSSSTSFWKEGLTADGAAWGHGRQTYVWGYPIDGVLGAMQIFEIVQNTAWEVTPPPNMLEVVINFIRASSWYYYKGYIPPVMGRENMHYAGTKKVAVRTKELALSVLKLWPEHLTVAEKEELNAFIKNAEKKNTLIIHDSLGLYSGVRYFFNQEDFIKKNHDYYVLINMGSSRSDGTESSKSLSAYNYYNNDGVSLFERSGKEYQEALGAWNLTSWPGVTARQGEDRLKPITNWRGFTSKHNFAGGVHNNSSSGVAGFIYEKKDASSPTSSSSTGYSDIIFDVKARKGYFFFDDFIVCLGAGIENLRPAIPGDIFTTIDQTLWSDSVSFFDGEKVEGLNPQQNYSLIVKPGRNGQVTWVNQVGGFAYFFFPEWCSGSIHLSAENKDTKWKKLSVHNKSRNVPKKQAILHLYVNHGDLASGAGTYGYGVYAGKASPQDALASLPVKVLANDTLLQSVANFDESVVGAIFYNDKAVLTTSEYSYSVNTPCIIMVEKLAHGERITVSDPEMSLTKNEIILYRSKADGSSPTSTRIPLPAEPFRGKPTSVINVRK